MIDNIVCYTHTDRHTYSYTSAQHTQTDMQTHTDRHNTHYTMHNTQYAIHNTQYTIHNTQHPTHNAQYTDVLLRCFEYSMKNVLTIFVLPQPFKTK